MARLDPQSWSGARRIEDLTVADEPKVAGELSALSVREIVDKSEHEFATTWIGEQSKLRSRLPEVARAAMIIEDHGVPDEHRDLEDLAELLGRRPRGHHEERLHEREESGGDLGLLHREIVATFSVQVEISL